MSVTTAALLTSAADPSCQVSEVARLLWSMIALAVGAGVILVARPRWLGLAALVAADLLWVWIDMEGPTLVVRGGHGLHLADVPVLVTVPALALGTVRLWLRRRQASASTLR